MTKKTVKVKGSKVKAHERKTSNGGKTQVKSHRRAPHSRNVSVADLEKIATEIDRDLAQEMFHERSDHAKQMDLSIEANLMFAVPNKYWAGNINRSDIWAIDGFQPPITDKYPKTGLPYQLVEYKGIIFEADAGGVFKPQLKILSIDPFDEKCQDRFEKETGKNALWRGRVTKAFKAWLKEQEKERKMERIATKMQHGTRYTDLNLIEIRDLYNDLDVTKEELQQIFIHLANMHYSGAPARSFTKQVQEFHDHIFHDQLEAAIRKARRPPIDPARQKQGGRQYIKDAKKGTGLAKTNIRNALNALGRGDISDASIVDKMRAWDYKSGDRAFVGDIVEDLIEKFKEGDDPDTDIYDPKAMEAQELKEWESMKEYYEKGALEQYEDMLLTQGHDDKTIDKALKDYVDTGTMMPMEEIAFEEIIW